MEGHATSQRWWTDAERDPIHATAAEWLVRLQEPDLSVEETAAWQEWMAADPRHSDAFQRMEEIWAAAETIEDRAGPDATDYDCEVPIGEWMGNRAGRRRRLAWSALAASILCALIGAAWWWTGLRGHWIETPIGQNRAVTLADGSQIELGGDSAIRVRLEDTVRHIELLRGEAFFTVAKDPGRPFEVRAGAARVVAVGTAFNVRRGSERVVVAVLEGRVKITSAQHNAPVPVDAGEQSVVVKSRIEAAARLTSPAAATAWQSGRLSFDEEPLRYALEVVNRYSVKSIVVGDEDVGELRITGLVLSDNVDGWVKSLERAFDLEATEEPERIVLRRR
jgi:transmembrane sensor